MASNRAGGAATAGGMDFQHRTSAWLAVRVLAELAATAPWDLGENVFLESIRCETGQPIDDILVSTSAGGYLFFQVKKTVSVSSRPNSDLADVLDQFVRQFLSCRDGK